jgi:energy-coupling factor transporter ATP-binding protein EcfA2
VEIISVRDLTFTYPGRERPALDGVSFDVGSGEVIALCGRSGSGKTTLLRLLKPSLAPNGSLSGTVSWPGLCGSGSDEAVRRDVDPRIGFVLQDPESQIVTDKVWHELAFGPENLGWDPETIRIRVAEMASWFGIQNWFRKDVSELSGGEKQIMNLAAVMVMGTRVLLLDEPASQLDPVAEGEFLSSVRKLSDETGVTVMITGHRLDGILPMCDRMIVLDGGRMIADDTPGRGAAALAGNDMFRSMPAPVRICGLVDGAAGKTDEYPVDVRGGRRWLGDLLGRAPGTRSEPESAGHAEKSGRNGDAAGHKEAQKAEPVLTLRDLWFRYSREGDDVIRGLDAEVYSGECFAVLGGNGTGKTTMLKLAAGILKPYHGRVDRHGRSVLMLPQDPQTVFAAETVREELEEMSGDPERIRSIAEAMEIEEVLDSHPYDISGGEQERAALAKLLLKDPDIILLDEPTKGMDGAFKEKLAGIFARLKAAGMTLVMVSHDIEFCAMCADRCALFFDGGITTSGVPEKFFPGNRFYTTAAGRMTDGFFTGVVTAEDAAERITEELAARGSGTGEEAER